LSEWEPATEAEAAMRDALAASDQEHYFRILARSELLLPVSAEAIAGRAPMGWGTWTTSNRTHVLAFSSPAALSACLNEPGGSYRTLSFRSLAADWPNYEWWLAVNPGLPIEAYLPSWFVSQLTRGDVRLPGRPMGSRARMAPSDLAAALSGRVRAAAPAGPRDDRDVVEPGARSAPAAAGRQGPLDAQPVVVRPHEGVIADAETVDAEIIDYPPSTSPTEYASEPSGSDPRGQTPGAFAGNARLAEAAVAPGTRVTPDAGYSSGTAFVAQGRFTAPRPAAATPSPPSVARPARARQAAQDAEIVAEPEGWKSAFTPANETEASLLAAVESNNTDSFLSTLLLARVILPVPEGTTPTAHPRDRDFPWRVEESDGKRFISVFTSPERLNEHRYSRFGVTVPTVSLRFVQLIGAWPDQEIAFKINPGSPVGATLPGSQIVALASWAVEVGLRDEPMADVVVAPKRHESTPVMGVAGAPTAGADRVTVMQRAVPPAQLSFYLDRGYDRVSGFVNRASEVAHLTSPKALYRALGLVYSGSPFAEDDAEVHVLRWVAHRTDLYRIPYGGQHEAAMRAMQGWVIERAPFRGNSFAPSDTDVVAEFKVDSVRLPHGAQMWRLATDGTETLVATFDADTTKWVPAAVVAPGLRGGAHA
jgi:hypothetical protein